MDTSAGTNGSNGSNGKGMILEEAEEAQVVVAGAADVRKPRREPVKVATHPVRVPQSFSIRETFGVDLGVEVDKISKKPLVDSAGKPIPRDRQIQGFADRTEWVPEIDPSYEFPNEETKNFLLGIASKDKILLTGMTGCGKTTLVEQVAARLNYNVVRVNLDGAVTRADLVGEWIVRGREMVFNYGILPMALRLPGTILLLDEWDATSGECSFVLQRVLEPNGKLLLMETGGELIAPHPDNVIVATANTVGQGDDTGLYSPGTRVQNYAQINRFTNTIKLSYLPKDKEIAMLMKKVSDGPKPLSEKEAITMVNCITLIRESYSKGEIAAPLSPRDLINWARKTVVMASMERAAKIAFLNRATEDDAATMEGIIRRAAAGEKTSTATAQTGIKK